MEERVGEGKTAFVVNDRRGEKKEPREEVPVVSEAARKAEASKDKSKWKDVSYLIVQAQVAPGAVVNVLRGCGERSDGRPFVADWLMPQYWTDKADIIQVGTKNVRGRLDTFLNCGCMEGGNACDDHRESIALWGKLDMERLNKLSNKPMPSSLELVIRAEQARQQSSIVKPNGRG
jgi:hypothetical protein